MAPEVIERTGCNVEHKLHHVRQSYNWDCGVSCILMLLLEDQRDDFMANFSTICEEEGFNQSTWTIDLCYLLKRFNINHKMYTIMAGVNEGYSKFDYYDKIIDLDRERVVQRFATAATRGIHIVEGSLRTEDLLQHVTQGPAIVLVDASKLTCDLCRAGRLAYELRRCFGGGGYRGHYIVVMGRANGRLLYRDPARRPRICVTSLRRLHEARVTPGTDEDIILIYKKYT